MFFSSFFFEFSDFQSCIMILWPRRHDSQHNDTQHNDTHNQWVICDIQHDDPQHKQNSVIMLNIIMLSVAFYLLLCWVSLCWMSLCWVSWRLWPQRLIIRKLWKIYSSNRNMISSSQFQIIKLSLTEQIHVVEIIFI